MTLPSHIQDRFKKYILEFQKFSKSDQDLIIANLEFIYGNNPKNIPLDKLSDQQSNFNKQLFLDRTNNNKSNAKIDFIEKVMNDKNKSDFFKEENKEVFFLVHQTQNMQDPSAEYAKNLKGNPKVVALHSSIFPIQSKALEENSDFVMLSKIGALNLPPDQSFEKVHLAGGFCDLCMKRAFEELIKIMKTPKRSSQKPKEIYIHLSQIYGKGGTILDPKILRNDVVDGKIDFDHNDLFIDLGLQGSMPAAGFPIPDGEVLKDYEGLGNVIKYPFESETERFNLIVVP